MRETTGSMSGLDLRIDREIDNFFGNNFPEGKGGIRPGVPFETEVGTCKGVGCNGKILYRLKWKQGSEPVVDISMAFRVSGQEGILVCSCERCGMLYDTSHPRYEDIFERAYAEFFKEV